MRWLLPVFLVACADDAAQGNLRCEEGPELVNDAVTALVAKSPGCVRDDECVLQQTGVSCEGFIYGSCGTPMHRDTAAQWDAGAVCREIEKLPAERGLTCQSSPSCALAEPACVDGRCSSR